MNTGTIPSDVQNEDQPLFDDEAIADAFGKLDEGYEEEEPEFREEDRFDPEIDEPEPDDTPLDGEESEDELEDADTDEEGDAPDADEEEALNITDEHTVSVQVNGEDQEFSIGQLKRLAGQEAAITQKAQAVAQLRQAVQQQDQLAKASYEKLLARVNEKLAPYKDIDLVRIARNPNVTDAQLEAIKTEMNDLQTEKAFLEEGLDAHLKSLQETEQHTKLAAAREAILQIEDQASPFYIDGFRGRYNDLKAYAVKQGADQKFIDELVDPWTWKIISDSLTLSSTREKASAKRKATRPKTSAKKTKRTRSTNRADRSRGRSKSQALERLRRDPGSEKALLDAFGALDG